MSSTITNYTAVQSGDWNDGANWDNGVPVGTLAAIVDNTGTASLTVTFGGGDGAATCLAMYDATLAITAGNLMLASASSLDGYLQAGGELEFDNSGATAASRIEGSFTQTGGVILIAAGQLTLDSRGTSELAGTVTGPGTLFISSPFGQYTSNFLLGAADLSVATLQLNAAMETLEDNLSYAGTFIESYGTMDLDGHDLTLSGQAEIVSEIAGNGTVLVPLGAAATLDSYSSSFEYAFIGNGAVLDVRGMLYQDGNAVIGTGDSDPVMVTIAATGLFDLRSDNALLVYGAATIANQGLLEKTGGSDPEGSLIIPGIANSGTVLDAYGTLDLAGSVTNTGLIEVEGSGTDVNSVLTLNAISGPGTIAITDGEARFYDPATGGVVSFLDSAGLLVITDNASAPFADGITGFRAGDTIVIEGGTATGATFANDVLTLTGSTGALSAPLAIRGAYAADAFSVARVSGGIEIFTNDLACFAAGTRILTGRGEIPVENLRAGETVITHEGEDAALIWAGRREIDLRRHAAPRRAQPVLIEAGALAEGVPARDLVLSPDHALYLSGHLIPAKALINGCNIHQLTLSRVIYHHLELAEHGVIFAENTPVESYLETGNRGAFENEENARILHPDFGQSLRETAGCAPFAESGLVVDEIRYATMKRATMQRRSPKFDLAGFAERH